MAKTLVNFLIEKSDLDRFDAIASMIGRTRTSILTEMMGLFCSEQIVNVELRNRKLEQLNQALTQQHLLLVQAEEARQINRPLWQDVEDMDLPSPFMSDGHDEF
ncbi:hypothetical protein IP81_15660 [Novosphingobium sp. AAP83]|uniref:hypothetical protein n=1 Tax=Novosphingobium sp. AAP83 TaxID=1523425 RepID=UPI0006B89951|nr:hypothetical protein [Novosphingobium sp. AAP83]KPF90307.1 hypothetical protein IP81_15660 [Novosphingobium sp. AAP83]